MKKGKDYGLLIASMVAIVAIVGLVIMFSSGMTGAGFAKTPATCWEEDGKWVCYGETGTGSFPKTPREDRWMNREQANTAPPFKSTPETEQAIQPK